MILVLGLALVAVGWAIAWRISIPVARRTHYSTWGFAATLSVPAAASVVAILIQR